jgi:long-chain fatty acid transport protein
MRRSTCTWRVCTAAAIAGAIPVSLSPAAIAGGFGIEQSAYYQGMSYAGAAAGGESLAAIAWNPATASFAGSGLLMEATASGLLISSDVTVSNPQAQIPPVGAAETDVGRNALIGASFFTYRLDSKTVLGLSLTSPFGLGTKPNDTEWAGKYEGITTFVFNIDATPMVSYEVVPGVSVAAGVQIDYFGLKRQTAQTPLGLANFQADDIGVGGVAGITVVPMPGTSIGLGYRSAISHTLEGHTELGAIAKTDAQANVILPDMASLGLRHALTPTTRVLGEVEWVNWSRLGVIPIVITEPITGLVPANTAVANLDFQWRDGWLFSIGGEYDWSPVLTLRTGVAYEISPVDGPTTRLVQDPDSNRVWLSLGGSYDWDRNTRLDFSYSHVFYENDAPFNRVPASTLFTGPNLLGTADLSMDVFSIGFKTDLNALMSSLH